MDSRSASQPPRPEHRDRQPGSPPMNFRLTAILFGSIFVLGLVLLILSFTGDDRPPTDILVEELAGAKAGDIDAVEIEREGGAKLKMVHVDKNRWNIVEPYTARADAGAIEGLVS